MPCAAMTETLLHSPSAMAALKPSALLPCTVQFEATAATLAMLIVMVLASATRMLLLVTVLESALDAFAITLRESPYPAKDICYCGGLAAPSRLRVRGRC